MEFRVGTEMMDGEIMTENGVIVTPLGKKEREISIGTYHLMNVKIQKNQWLTRRMFERKTCSHVFSIR